MPVQRKWEILVRDINHLLQFSNGQRTVEIGFADASYGQNWRFIYTSVNHHVIICSFSLYINLIASCFKSNIHTILSMSNVVWTYTYHWTCCINAVLLDLCQQVEMHVSFLIFRQQLLKIQWKLWIRLQLPWRNEVRGSMGCDKVVRINSSI